MMNWQKNSLISCNTVGQGKLSNASYHSDVRRMRPLVQVITRALRWARWQVVSDMSVGQGCNSIGIFLVPKPAPSHVRTFETCLNLERHSTEAVPNFGQVLHPVLGPKFKLPIECTPGRLLRAHVRRGLPPQQRPAPGHLDQRRVPGGHT